MLAILICEVFTVKTPLELTLELWGHGRLLNFFNDWLLDNGLRLRFWLLSLLFWLCLSGTAVPEFALMAILVAPAFGVGRVPR